MNISSNERPAAGETRGEWVTPAVTRLKAGSAENFNPGAGLDGTGGPFDSGS